MSFILYILWAGATHCTTLLKALAVGGPLFNPGACHVTNPQEIAFGDRGCRTDAGMAFRCGRSQLSDPACPRDRWLSCWRAYGHGGSTDGPMADGSPRAALHHREPPWGR